MRNLLLALFAFVLTACGANAPSQSAGAALRLDIVFPAPDLRAFAAADTEAALTKLEPRKLLVLVCDNVKLSREVKVFCSESEKDYNRLVLFDDFNAGSGIVEDIPPAKDQVIFVQGLAADNSVTYQGFATLPTIEPRVTYDVNIEMRQTVFPDLPKPDAPIVLVPFESAVTVAPSVTHYVFEGTRVANTRLRVSTSYPGLGGVRQFSGDDPPLYDETVNADGSIDWKVTVELPSPESRTSVQTYTFSFDVSRTGEEKFSDKATRTIALCSINAPVCSL